MYMNENLIIEAQGIEKSFDNLKVLKGINLSIYKSELISIMGASGAGKSTLLQILGTLSKADSGQLFINNKDVSKLKGSELAQFRNKEIGFVFQFHHLLSEFTALENVIIPALIGGENEKTAKYRANELLARVGLKDRVNHKPNELSGGEAQRVAIARAMINNPSVIFADEPSGNLDSVTRLEIHQLFHNLSKDFGQSIVIVTHDKDLASMCDRSLFMKDGIFI